MWEMCDDEKWVQQTSCGATCIECEKCKQRFFLRKKLSRHQETLLVLNLMFLTMVESLCNAISSKKFGQKTVQLTSFCLIMFNTNTGNNAELTILVLMTV